MKKYGNERQIDATKKTQKLLSVDIAKEAEEMREKEGIILKEFTEDKENI